MLGRFLSSELQNLSTYSAVAKVCRGHIEKIIPRNLPNILEIFHCGIVGTLQRLCPYETGCTVLLYLIKQFKMVVSPNLPQTCKRNFVVKTDQGFPEWNLAGICLILLESVFLTPKMELKSTKCKVFKITKSKYKEMQIKLCKLYAQEYCCHYEMQRGVPPYHPEMEGGVSHYLKHQLSTVGSTFDKCYMVTLTFILGARVGGVVVDG